METQLNLPLATKQQWLESIELAMACKQQHAFGSMAGEQCLVQRFLGLDHT